MKHKLTQSKAKEIMRHGEVRGKKLTKKQRGFFGAKAGGAKMKKLHNPQSPYGSQPAKATSSSTPRYTARGKMNVL